MALPFRLRALANGRSFKSFSPGEYQAYRQAIDEAYRADCAQAENPHELWPIVASFAGQPFTRLDLMRRGNLHNCAQALNHKLATLVKQGALRRVEQPRIRMPRRVADKPPYHGRSLPVTNAELVDEYVSEKLSILEIAKRHDIAYQTVWAHLKQAGIELRETATRYQAIWDTGKHLAAANKLRDQRLAALEREWRQSPFSRIVPADIAKLPPVDKRVLEGRLKGYSFTTIGKRLKLSRQRVEQIQSRAFRLLEEM